MNSQLIKMVRKYIYIYITIHDFWGGMIHTNICHFAVELLKLHVVLLQCTLMQRIFRQFCFCSVPQIVWTVSRVLSVPVLVTLTNFSHQICQLNQSILLTLSFMLKFYFYRIIWLQMVRPAISLYSQGCSLNSVESD